MLHKIIEFIKGDSIRLAVVFYLCLALTEQISNGILGTKFVIKDLTDIFVWVFAQLSIKHGIDSKYNSVDGVMPK